MAQWDTVFGPVLNPSVRNLALGDGVNKKLPEPQGWWPDEHPATMMDLMFRVYHRRN